MNQWLYYVNQESIFRILFFKPNFVSKKNKSPGCQGCCIGPFVLKVTDNTQIHFSQAVTRFVWLPFTVV